MAEIPPGTKVNVSPDLLKTLLGTTKEAKASTDAIKDLNDAVGQFKNVFSVLGLEKFTLGFEDLGTALKSIPTVIGHLDAAFKLLPRHGAEIGNLTTGIKTFGTSLKGAGDDVAFTLQKIGALTGLGKELTDNYIEAADHANQFKLMQISLAAASGTTAEFFGRNNDNLKTLDQTTQGFLNSTIEVAAAQGLLARDLQPVAAELYKIPGAQEEGIRVGNAFKFNQLEMAASLGQAFGQDPKSFANLMVKYHRTLGTTGKDAVKIFGSMAKAANEVGIPMELLIKQADDMTVGMEYVGGSFEDAAEMAALFKKGMPNLSVEAAVNFGKSLSSGIAKLDMDQLFELSGLLGRSTSARSTLQLREDLRGPEGSAGRVKILEEIQSRITQMGPILTGKEAIDAGEGASQLLNQQRSYLLKIAALTKQDPLQVEAWLELMAKGKTFAQAVAEAKEGTEEGGRDKDILEFMERGKATGAAMATVLTTGAQEQERQYYAHMMEANKVLQNLTKSFLDLGGATNSLVKGLTREGGMTVDSGVTYGKGAKSMEDDLWKEKTAGGKIIEAVINAFKIPGLESKTPSTTAASSDQDVTRQALTQSMKDQEANAAAIVAAQSSLPQGNAVVSELQNLTKAFQTASTQPIIVKVEITNADGTVTRKEVQGMIEQNAAGADSQNQAGTNAGAQ